MNPREQGWEIIEPGRDYSTGPFTYAELKLRYEAHEINGDTRCWLNSFGAVSPFVPLKTLFPEFKSGEEWPIAAAPSHIKTGKGVGNAYGMASSSSASKQQKAGKSLSEPIDGHSSWATIFRFIGGLCILIGTVGLVALVKSGNNSANESVLILIIVGFAGAIQSFFLAFLIEVFTDIRGFLKKIAEGRSRDT